MCIRDRTYTFENSSGSGYTSTLPCQYYAKLTNNTSTSKDVQFRISDVDLLPYMRKEELSEYDGMGWSAKNFKLLYQITTDNNRPSPDAWKYHDFTTTGLTATTGATINPKILEIQNPTALGFSLNYTNSYTDKVYSIMDSLGMAHNSDHNTLQFGDERFFYGNINTYIGATIYKTMFDVNVASSEFNATTNPTRSQVSSTNPPNIKVSEVAIYDSAKNLVCIGKLSTPVALLAGNTIMLELSMDF